MGHHTTYPSQIHQGYTSCDPHWKRKTSLNNNANCNARRNIVDGEVRAVAVLTVILNEVAQLWI